MRSLAILPLIASVMICAIGANADSPPAPPGHSVNPVSAPPSAYIQQALKANHDWARRINATAPALMAKLETTQEPRILWIGCSDSRVAPSVIMQALPGTFFEHRNVANIIKIDDPSSATVIEYAVANLHVTDIIVAGHSDCGGVKAAIQQEDTNANPNADVISRWILPIREIYRSKKAQISHLPKNEIASIVQKANIINSMNAVINSASVQAAWRKNAPLTIHGWRYNLDSHLLEDLQQSVSGPQQNR